MNDQRGLEHGFTVAERPAADSALISAPSALSFTLTTRGDLRPAISADARSVSFRNASGTTALTYSGLKVWDADGKVLPSHFEPVGPQSFRLLVDESSARYPITIDPIAQQAYLKASNTETFDGFARAIAVDADTVVIGAPFEDSNATGVNGNQADNSSIAAGAAYVFTRIWRGIRDLSRRPRARTAG